MVFQSKGYMQFSGCSILNIQQKHKISEKSHRQYSKQQPQRQSQHAKGDTSCPVEVSSLHVTQTHKIILKTQHNTAQAHSHTQTDGKNKKTKILIKEMH